jgi:hypothetical protein
VLVVPLVVVVGQLRVASLVLLLARVSLRLLLVSAVV